METFQEYLQAWPAERRTTGVARATEADVLAALQKEILQPADFLALLSPAAAPHLEAMAQRARDLTLRFFGRAVNIFTPLYIRMSAPTSAVTAALMPKTSSRAVI